MSNGIYFLEEHASACAATASNPRHAEAHAAPANIIKRCPFPIIQRTPFTQNPPTSLEQLR